MAKIVIFSNQKGGTGKSSLCILFSNYLASMGENVAVLDADPQQSILHLRERELKTNPDAKEPWRVWQLAGAQNIEAFMERAKKLDGWVLVDCPGSLNDPSLAQIFKAATHIIIPFRYDDMVVDSTLDFVRVLKQRSSAKRFFIPNNVDSRVNYANKSQVKTALDKIGIRLPTIRQGVAVMRALTLSPLSIYQERAIMHSVDEFIKKA